MIGQTISHYKILEELGHGGMGVVYRAEDSHLHRPVALKLLWPESVADNRARIRFAREAEVAAKLGHPNIATIFDFDEATDPSTSTKRSFIAMEYVEGETLRQLIERGPLAVDRALSIAKQIASGMAAAHRRGIIHRDLKPANVIVRNDGSVKVLDFGLARLAGESRLTEAGMVVGTVAYMAPEQVMGEEADDKADIWSLGVILFEMLTQQLPFRGDHAPAMMYAIVNEDSRSLQDLRGETPPHLIQLCRRCLVKDRGGRPASMQEVLDILSEAAPAVQRQEEAARRVLPARTVLLSLLIVAAAAVAFVLWNVSGRKAIARGPADYVVVADVENRTTDSLFNHSLTSAIKVSLRQSKQFNVLPAERIDNALQALQITRQQPFDEQTALKVARREGARALVASSIQPVGSSFALIGKIIDPRSGEVVGLRRQEVPRIEAVLSGMDELCEDLRRTLGESIAQIAQAHSRLEDVTTPSLEALELYSRANVIESEGNYRDASVLLDRAIAIDSLFTMAVSDAAYAHRKIGEDSLAAFYHSRVLPLLHRVTERERLEIMITYYGPSFALDFQKAFQAVQQLTALDPNNAYAYAMLGHLAMNAGDTEAALAANEKAVALFPDYAKICYNNSGYALALDGKGGDALAYFRRAKELRPTYSAIDCYIAQTHWVNGDLDSAVTTAEAILPVADPTRRNQVRVLLGSLFFFQGRLGRAWQELSLCAGAYRAMKKPGDEAYIHWMLGEVAAEEGRVSDYRREMTTAEQLCSSPFFELALVGCSFAKHGSVAESERVARKIQVCRSYDPLFVRRSVSFVHLVKAGLLFAERRYRKAQGEFEAIERVQAGDPLYLIALKGIADCLSAEGDTATFACYAALLARRGEAIMGTLSPLRNSGPWTSWLWPEIHLELGRLYAAAGQNDVAVDHLRAALRCWQNADGIYRKAAEARGLLARVGGKE